MATLDQVLGQMHAAGMPPMPSGHPILDGVVHRYGPRRKCWYVLHEFRARNGKHVIVGAFGRWSGTDNGKIPIKADFSGMEPDEFRRLQATQTANEVRERDKRAQRVRAASMRAVEQWKRAQARPAPDQVHPYLARKRLQWENGLRIAGDGTLYVPMVRYEVTEEQAQDPAYTGPARLAGLQKILPDGAKLFNKGMDPVGAACRFGRKPKDGELLLVGEGLATVLSAHQLLERAYTCFVAFTAGNLLPVARSLRKLYPKSAILFLADDDAYLEAQLNHRLRTDWGVTELYRVLDNERELPSDKFGRLLVRADVHEDANGTPILTAGIRAVVNGEPDHASLRTLIFTNAGRTKAWEAAGELGNAFVAFPKYADRALTPDPDAPRLTDFNDLHGAEGPEAAAKQLGAAIGEVQGAIELARAIAAGVAPGGAAAAGGDEAQAGKGVGGGESGPDWRLHWSLINRFVLVERAGLAWDEQRGRLWRIEHLRLSFGTAPVAMWLASRRRRAVDVEQVVFDPRGVEDPKKTVNLFRGIETKPGGEGKCDKLLELLRYLCGEHEATERPVTDWVLRWCAYQVQNVGAKMKTAVVMYGPEGTGKNLFWSALLDIFRPYSVLIGQAELEDKHNTWQSAKLFIVANEVVTRSEMSHHVGRLKALITEDFVHINPKFVDVRYERNHMNMVFLSNEFQPLKISPGDRRYMVIRTPAAMPEDFYKAVAAEFAAGGAAAFMQHLAELDLAGFGEHTKPIVTDAKRDLIEIGMLPSQLFWQEMKDGLVPLPYCPALTQDVYRAYTLWCARSGYKMPEGLNRFTPNFMSMNGVRRHEPRIADPDSPLDLAKDKDTLRKRRVFVMGSRPDGLNDEAWLTRGITDFRKALRAFEAEGEGRLSSDSAPASAQRQSAF